MTKEYPPKRPVRFFNTTGPCEPWDHYMLPPADRLIGGQLDRYVRDRLYWVLHAPRQTGKTTFLKDWARELRTVGDVAVCYITAERCQRMPELEQCMPTLCAEIQIAAKTDGLPVPELKTENPGSMLSDILMNFSEIVAPKPLVLLIDETDALEGNSMISFLRQLRGGFMRRGVGTFPISIALVGMRDLKDYITEAKDGVQPSPLSPFNIKADSALIGNFSQDDVRALFAQRTEETGQQIAPDALEYVWEQSMGQPWLVNSLFMRATMRVLKDDDNSTVTLDHVRTAREQMILARETHLDSLAVRLREPGVRKIMETFFSGGHDPRIFETDAFRVCCDLGLTRVDPKSGAQISNPIYREVLAREITYGNQLAIPDPEEQGWRWLNPDGSLDMDGLLKAFQAFWRENSEMWEQKSDYTEAFPHLLIMSFLQRILNGGARIDREYAAGRGRMDLLIEHNNKFYVIEVKMIYENKSPKSVKTEGLAQIARYRDAKAPGAPAYLVIFDRRPSAKKASWNKKISWTTEGGVTVLGC